MSASLIELVKEGRYTASVLAGPAGNNPPIVRALRGLADAAERMAEPLREIAVDVVLADDLPSETQIAGLWSVVRRHTQIAKEALEGQYEPTVPNLLAIAHAARALFMDGLSDPPNSVIFDPHGAVDEIRVLAEALRKGGFA